MKYIKLFENYNSDEINPMEYLESIVDVLNHKSYSVKDIDIKGDQIFLGKYEVKLDKYGNVKVCKGSLEKIVGRINLKPTISDDGNLNNFNFTEYKYSDGTPIEIGDDVIVDKTYHVVVDGFLDGEVVVQDQQEETFYVKPSQLKKYIRKDPPNI